MFRSDASTSVFALPPGVDFPAALVGGIRQRMAEQPPEAMARIQLVVNTRRMARRIRELFDAGPPCLLPRISLVTEPGALASLPPLPVPVSPLRRRLELIQLVEKLLQRQPDLAPRSSAYDLSDSLAALIDEMQGEGVAASAIRQLDVTDLSGHWARAQAFIGIADRFLHADSAEWDIQGRNRRQVAQLIAHWQAHPPNNPVILAGSTGSRGTTHLLMQAIARVPNGTVVLPGFDFDQPAEVWAGLDDALLGEDHPQFRFHNLMRALDIAPGQVQRWSAAAAPSEARNKLISLALRPAPVTDAWMTEGPKLSDLAKAMQEVTLVEAPTPRAEALSIALRLRQAAETGQTAALITPDRMLTRQVGAALDRWNILPDDSAGLPLHLSPPGRFLRHVAGLFTDRLDGQALLTILKHPLCHDGQDRGSHLLHTRDLELDLRRNGPPFPDALGLRKFAARKGVSDTWLDWLVAGVCNRTEPGSKPLSIWVTQLRETAEDLSAGSAEGATGTIWDRNAGQKALAIVTALETEAGFGGDMTARDFGTLLHGLLAAETVRDRDAPRADIMIWGTLEARVMGADLLILGGLNENSWPEAADPDPWLNRQMRDQAGLLLPERRIGLAAHDFQQAVGAREAWLTRSARSDDAETVPSRWLNRLTNLLQGLPDTGGPDVLADMRARGQIWLGWASQLEQAKPLAPAARPSPQPPLSARPRRLSVTEIKRLIRDPYAIYARHVLRLRPLDPLVQAPDALLRGVVVHE
ncbi:MAG: double-strand break repair protein AddB, partial [Pseudomonadota bacterium]